jgi:hypothetical protein
MQLKMHKMPISMVVSKVNNGLYELDRGEILAKGDDTCAQ